MCTDLVPAVNILVHHFERFVDTLRSIMAIILGSAVADKTRLLSISTELCHIFIFLLY